MRYCVLLFLSLLLSLGLSHDVLAQVRTVKILSAQTEFDSAHQMNIALVELALQKTTDSHGPSRISITKEHISYGHVMRLLNTGHIDVSITGTNKQREAEFLPIRIPLLKGILGVRSLVIRPQGVDKLNGVSNKQQLAKLLACQKDAWPDSDILDDNQLPVYRTDTFEALFTMIVSGKCDYLPRGIHEGPAEVAAYNAKHNTKLIVYDDLLLVYPFPMYFFVKKGNTALAEQLEQGLGKAMRDGSYVQMLKQHPVTQHLFPLSQWRKKRVIYLSNNDLPPLTPVNQPQYWWPEFFKP